MLNIQHIVVLIISLFLVNSILRSSSEVTRTSVPLIYIVSQHLYTIMCLPKTMVFFSMSKLHKEHVYSNK